MIITKKQINKLQKELSEKYENSDYYVVGLRIVDTDYDDYNAQIGDILPDSRVWIDNNYTDEELDGTCAIALIESGYKTRSFVTETEYAGYSGNRAFIIAGDNYSYGEDQCEIIIKNAQVIDIINF